MSIAGARHLDARERSITSLGVQGRITGSHFDLILFDDVVDDKNSENPDLCEKVIQYYRQMTPILQGSGTGAQFRIVGTHWSFADLYSHMLDQLCRAIGCQPEDLEGFSQILPCDHPDRRIPFALLKFGVYEEDGETTRWPENNVEYSEEALLGIRDDCETPQHWSNQYLNQIISAEEQLVTKELFHRFWDDLPPDHVNWPTFCAIDPSMGTYRDKSAIWSWTVDPDGYPWLIDIYDGMIRPPELIDQVYARNEKYHYERIFWEMHLTKQLWIPLLEQAYEKRGHLNITPVDRQSNSKDKKASRIQSLGSFINNGYLRVWKRCAMLDALEAQLYYWPRCRTDDILDAGAEMVQRVRPPKRAKVVAKQQEYVDPTIRALWRGGTTAPNMPEWVKA
jgi:hypothetical protein